MPSVRNPAGIAAFSPSCRGGFGTHFAGLASDVLYSAWVRSPWGDGGHSCGEVVMVPCVDEKAVYRLAKRRDLPGSKAAPTWRFKRDDINARIEKQKAAVR
jgi:hypothetical protein